MKVFLDTNVIISAFVSRGLCEDLFRAVLVEHELITGEVVLDEVDRVLNNKLGLPSSLVGEILSLLRAQIVAPKPAAPADIEIRDSDDAWVLASAIESGAEVLIAGDRDLLDLEDVTTVRIMNPREFWNLLSSGRETPGERG